MTVVYESRTPKEYEIMKLPELCEMIGRVAELKYQKQVNLSLAEKIEFVLDALLKVIGGERCKQIE